MEYINVNELLTGHTALPVPETVEDAALYLIIFNFSVELQIMDMFLSSFLLI